MPLPWPRHTLIIKFGPPGVLAGILERVERL